MKYTLRKTAIMMMTLLLMLQIFTFCSTFLKNSKSAKRSSTPEFLETAKNANGKLPYCTLTIVDDDKWMFRQNKVIGCQIEGERCLKITELNDDLKDDVKEMYYSGKNCDCNVRIWEDEINQWSSQYYLKRDDPRRFKGYKIRWVKLYCNKGHY